MTVKELSQYYNLKCEIAGYEKKNAELEAKEAGAVSTERLIKWLYPDMTDEEIAGELLKINEAASVSEQSAIERALMM